MNNHKYHFLALVTFGFICFLSSCNDEVEASFTVPSSHRFNSPNLANKSVYKIDQQAKKGILLTDSLGDFSRSNSVISDSLNAIIRNAFVVNSLRSIQFKDGNTALLEFGRLDTTDGKSVIIPLEKKETKYIFTGNQIKFDSFPQYFAEITNSFLEVNLCQEFTYRSQRVSTGNHVKRYFHNNCIDTDHAKIISRIIGESPATIFDTISIERVNYIFSKY